MPLSSGELDRRITIERNEPARDGHGNDVPSWQMVANCWAKFMPGTGQERREAAQDQGALTAIFRVRKSSTLWPVAGARVGSRDRVIFQGNIWDVAAVALYGLDGLDVTATTGFKLVVRELSGVVAPGATLVGSVRITAPLIGAVTARATVAGDVTRWIRETGALALTSVAHAAVTVRGALVAGVAAAAILTGAATVRYMGLAATHCRALTTSIGGNKQVMARTAHDATTDITALKIAVANFMLTSTTSTEQGSGGTCTVKASIEYPAGTFTQLTFDSGSATKTIADAGLGFSDLVAVNIPNGATFWIRQYLVYTGNVLFNSWRNSARGDLLNAGATVTDCTTGGTISSVGNFSCPPFMILAQTNAVSVLLIGDSKCHGFNDTAESATTAGPGLRGEIAKSFPATLPFLNIATAGFRANLWPSQTAARVQTLPFFSHYVISLGHNDLYVSGDSAATIQTSIEAITAAILAVNPLAKITIATQSAKSSSAGGNWINSGDQTAISVAPRLTLNTAIRNHTVAGQNNGHFEVSRQLEAVNDNGIWKTDGVTNKLYTVDGVHEQPAGYNLIVSSGAIDYAAKFVR